MSFDKIKAMRSAERFMSQGKIRAAIGEYKQVVEHDPKDFGTLNMLGDLHAKNADKKQAVECFTRVAEYYGKQGFAQKAIAVYNKIARLKPDSAEITAKLAELYQSKGSFAEARVHYAALAEQFERAGKKIEALSVWKQIAELDTHNSEVYLKIAQSYLKENQKDEAADALTIAGERLAAQAKYEAALDAFSQTLKIRQNDLRALNGFVRAQISLGDSDEAAKTLEQILEQQPFNREILHLLADCHLDTNNPREAEKSIVKLVEQEPANYSKFLELIGVYLKNDDSESAARILSISSEHLLVGGQSEEFLKWTNEILARNPEHIEALRLLVRFYGWQRDESELRQALERLTEAARQAESIEDEHYALSQLVMIAPHEVAYASRLQEIRAEYDFPDDSEQPILSPPPTEENRFAAETPQFESFAPQHSEEISVGEANFAANGFGDYRAEFDFVSSNDANGAGEKDFAFVGDDFEAQIVEEFDEDEYDSFGKSDEPFERFGNAEISTESLELSAAAEMRLEKELESIEFYVAQGYRELAEKSLDALELDFGERREFAALREQMNGSPLSAPAEEVLPRVEFVENGAETVSETNADDESVVSFVEPQPAEPNVKGSDFLDDFRSDLGFEENDSPSAESDYETHYQTAIAYKEMGLMEDAIREFQDAINLVSPNDETRRFFACAHLLGHCFMEKRMPNLALLWYQRALETDRLKTEEKQSIWYEIGNAYEAGGDPEKALESFERIYAVNVDYRDVGARIENLHIGA